MNSDDHFDKSTDSTMRRALVSGDVEANTNSKTGCIKVIRYVLGCVALAFVLASWDMMSEIVQDLQGDYDHPWMIVWTLHCGYLIFLFTALPAVLLSQCICKDTEPVKIDCKRFGLATLYNCLLITSDFVWYLSLDHTSAALNAAIFNTICVFAYLLSVPILGHELMLRKLVALCFCLFGVGGILVSSLDSSSESAGSANATIVYGCHVGLQEDQPVIPIMFKLDGNISTLENEYSPWCYKAVPEPDSVESTPFGYVLVILAVIAFAIYEVVFAKCEGHGDLRKERKQKARARAITSRRDEYGSIDTYEALKNNHKKQSLGMKVADTLVTTGLMGLSNLIFLWIFFVLWHFTGIEKFEMPFEHSSAQAGCCWSSVTTRILINMGLGAMYTSSFLVGVALTDPLFMSVGLILIIPIQFATDFFLGKLHSITVGQVIGSVLIIVGFLVINLPLEKYYPKHPAKGDETSDAQAEESKESWFRRDSVKVRVILGVLMGVAVLTFGIFIGGVLIHVPHGNTTSSVWK